MTFIRKYYGVALLIGTLVFYGAFKFYQYLEFNDLSQNPKPGDIYLFEDDHRYNPYFVDFILEDSIYFFSHPFEFRKSIPGLNQINEVAFNQNIHYIYGRSEVKKLIQKKTIIKIYR